MGSDELDSTKTFSRGSNRPRRNLTQPQRDPNTESLKISMYIGAMGKAIKGNLAFVALMMVTGCSTINNRSTNSNNK